jgi:hypothetical protein
MEWLVGGGALWTGPHTSLVDAGGIGEANVRGSERWGDSWHG